MNIGDKFIYKPINYINMAVNENHIHYGKTVTIIGFESLGRFRISIDDFPPCNHREYHNRFLADRKELIEIN